MSCWIAGAHRSASAAVNQAISSISFAGAEISLLGEVKQTSRTSNPGPTWTR
jgi:hypothetical protein